MSMNALFISFVPFVLYIYILPLHCHHHNHSQCIRMGIDGSHLVNVSLISCEGQCREAVSMTLDSFRGRKKEPKREIEPKSSARP